jgi:phenylpyruvate tautomerase PptA (4-oxalocrotonate tautomerase family)
MKQELNILVVTHVDDDKVGSQKAYEAELAARITQAVKDAIGTPKKDTIVDFEYGDPV